MRILSVLTLFLLTVPALAQEGADAVTSLIPDKSPLSIRIRSLERADAITKEWLPILKAFGMKHELQALEEIDLSNMLFAHSGLSSQFVDKSRPVYLAMTGDDEAPVVIVHATDAASWEGVKELQQGFGAVVRSGAVVVGKPDALSLEARGTPTRYVDGDVTLHVYLGDLAERHKEAIEQKAAEAAMQAGAQPNLPDAVKALVLPIVSALKDAVFSVDSFDYALTWKGDVLESEGMLAVKPRTDLSTFLKRAGKPVAHDLAAYLPKDALLTFTTSGNADWPMKEMGAVLDAAAGGEGAGASVQRLLSLGAAIQEHLTGNTAGAMTMGGMMMGGSFLFLYELKEGSDPKAITDKLEVESVNAGMKKFGIPLSCALEKAVAKHGETELHRMTMQSENPMLAMQLAMYQTYFAVEGRYMFAAMSPTGEDDLKALIDVVRKGEKVEHPHLAAMQKLGGAHNIGFTWNLGALKPMAMMVGMFGAPPEIQQAMNNLPDNLPLSTAIVFTDGNLRWRGDWPVREVAKVAETLTKAKEEATKKEGEKSKEDEDY